MMTSSIYSIHTSQKTLNNMKTQNKTKERCHLVKNPNTLSNLCVFEIIIKVFNVNWLDLDTEHGGLFFLPSQDML